LQEVLLFPAGPPSTAQAEEKSVSWQFLFFLLKLHLKSGQENCVSRYVDDSDKGTVRFSPDFDMFLVILDMVLECRKKLIDAAGMKIGFTTT